MRAGNLNASARDRSRTSPVSGLAAVRSNLEHHPRDPFAVSASAALDALGVRWDELYGMGYDGTGWQAWRLDGTGELLHGTTPDELSAAILADLAWSAS